jgi:hypothetical protein
MAYERMASIISPFDVEIKLPINDKMQLHMTNPRKITPGIVKNIELSCIADCTYDVKTHTYILRVGYSNLDRITVRITVSGVPVYVR